MKTLVIYDSKFGNTERIAQTIADSLAENGPTKLLPADKVGPYELNGVELLLLGGPTQRHGLSPALSALLNKPEMATLGGMRIAAFDTRFRKSRLLTGSAARIIGKTLQRAGAALVAPPESFFVTDTPGPLEDGETERAAAWALDLVRKVTTAEA